MMLQTLTAAVPSAFSIVILGLENTLYSISFFNDCEKENHW